MKKLISVIVGCGAIAREHLAAISELENVEVAAVCDISPVRAEATADRFGIQRWYTDHDKLLSDIRPDMVHITTPPAFHASIARDFLASGVNVLCEKPITVGYADFQLLKAIALNNKLMLLENQQNRFHSSVLRIRQLIDSGKIGDILEIEVNNSINLTGTGSIYADKNSAHFTHALPGGPIGDFLPHIAYLAYMFTGEILDVRTVWQKRIADSPLPADEFRGLIKGKRASAYLSFNGSAKIEGLWLRVVGTQMRVEANLYEPPRLVRRRFRKGEPALMTLVDGISESRDVLRGSVTGFIRKLAGRSSYDGLAEFFASIYRALESRQPQPISLDEIDHTCALTEKLSCMEYRL